MTKLENLVGKKWLNFVQVTNFFADFLFLPTKIFADFFFTDKVFKTEDFCYGAYLKVQRKSANKCSNVFSCESKTKTQLEGINFDSWVKKFFEPKLHHII